MSVRNSLLAILAERPAHGYALKSEFERFTAGFWPLNIGQVYTTLDRLERDGLVEPDHASERDRQAWKITRSGRNELSTWFQTPVDDRAARDELAIKMLLAIAGESVDISGLLQTQRAAAMSRLQQYTREKRAADPQRDLPWLLLLDAFVLKAEAELKWLDLCDERTRRHRARGVH